MTYKLFVPDVSSFQTRLCFQPPHVYFVPIEFSLMCFFLSHWFQEYGRNLAAMGVEATKISAYRSLWECVAPEDKQSRITF